MTDTSLAAAVRRRTAMTTAWARRVNATAMGVRLSVFVTGALAGIIAASGVIAAGGFYVAVVVIAACAAAYPTRAWATTLIVLSGLLWTVGHDEGEYFTAAFLGVLLYVFHTAAAQAVALRTDTYVAAPVIRGWLGRTALVLLFSAAAAGVLAMLPLFIGEGAAPAGAWAVGAAAVLGLAFALAYLSHRRRG